jgi:peptidoglycan/xylan/chitin deacetylase (PgdA/CDA1 family)
VNSRVRDWADRTLRRSPGQALFRWRASRQLAVLAYHSIDDVERFEEHIRYIHRSLNPVSVDDVIAAWRHGRTLPRRSVLLTFDDGHPSVLQDAAPILEEYGLPGVAFVVAGMLDTVQPFWWDEVESLIKAGGTARRLRFTRAADWVQELKRMSNADRVSILSELRRSVPHVSATGHHLRAVDLIRLESLGIEVGNHTRTHPCLSRCDPDEVDQEVRSAHDTLTQALGHPPRTFAYPDGDWDPRTAALLRQLDYQLAFTFDHRLSDRRSSPLRVSRLRIDSMASLDRLQIVTTGLHPAIHRMRRGR